MIASGRCGRGAVDPLLPLQKVVRVEHDINRDYWMSASEARDHGVIDTIVSQTDATVAADRAEAAVQYEGDCQVGRVS